MAENTGRRAKASADGKVERGPTQRVVLKRERVLVIPFDGNDEADIAARVEAAAKALGPRQGPKPIDAWVVVGEFEADGLTKDGAIEMHAGKPGTPDAKQGAYKAPTTSAWAGGALYEAPPAPLVQRKALD